MILFLLLISLTNAKVQVSSDEVIRSGCLKLMAKQKRHPAREVCDCHQKNLKQRMNDQLMAVLAKTYRGQSIEKELDTIEGASVVVTFDASVKAECLKNPRYEVGPDEE